VWLDRALNLATAGLVGVALYFVTTERLMPALRGEPAPAIEGERLAQSFELEVLGDNGTADAARARVRVPARRPVWLFIFSSTCPACYANLPAWRRVLEASRGSAAVLAVGLERDWRAARAFVREHLPAAMLAMPEEPRRFTAALGVELVPFTALVAADGRAVYVRRGGMDSMAVAAAIRALGALAGSSTP
jgi:hypothetical protein